MHFQSALCIIRSYSFESWGNMLFLVGTCLAFVLYILYDVNSVLLKNRFLHSFFALGTVFLAVSTAGCFFNQWESCLMRRQPVFILGLLPGAAGFFLMIRSLFFSLPFDETYLRPQQKPPVYDAGMYALCRHPGPELGHLPVHDFVRCCQPSGYSLCGISGLLDLSSHVFQLQGISEIHTFPDSNPGKHTKSVAHTQII